MLFATIAKHLLQFTFDAGTSRGVLRQKYSYYIKIHSTEHDEYVGIGEVAPLMGLSPELDATFEARVHSSLIQFNQMQIDDTTGLDLSHIDLLCEQMSSLKGASSLLFGWETALIDYFTGGKRQLFVQSFSSGIKKSIEINGLIWMNAYEHMKKQSIQKIEAGFHTIKMKIGAIQWEEEYALLTQIRTQNPDLTLRVDANGAFDETNVWEKLNALAKLNIHSIEQPIQPKNFALMKALCAQSPVAIALDEELIGIHTKAEKEHILDHLNPPYIILKPTLHGGIKGTKEWIALAEERDIKWWMTSALESNVGLNAICQLTATYPIDLPQGLGTGQLYHNNIPSPLHVTNGTIQYQEETQAWDFSILHFSDPIDSFAK